jgi:SAM-dependent methyltransferase
MQNRILTDRDRAKYAPLIKKMFKAIPDMMSRKFDRANVQQAFAVDLIMKKYKKGNDVLCVGSYEDTAFEYLKKIGYVMTDIDPQTNGFDLHKYLHSTDRKFDIVFSVSVMEHVDNDKQFVSDICKLLKPGGLGIVTVDFREDFLISRKGAANKPGGDFRLYTKSDYDRIADIISRYNCFFVDEFFVDAEPDFVYQNLTYSFSTMVFKKC